MLEFSHHFLYHTTLTMKSHNIYKAQHIEYNYNQIWHGIKANKIHICKSQLYKLEVIQAIAKVEHVASKKLDEVLEHQKSFF